MFCNNCGTKLPEGVDFCPNCGENVKKLFNGTKEKPEVPVYNSVGGFSTNTGEEKTKPAEETKEKLKRLGTLVLSENEDVIKKYHCCSVRMPGSEGYLSVTNKRLLFQAEGNGVFFESRIDKEISIDKITGLDCYRGTNISILQCIIGIILSVLGLYNYVQFADSYFVDGTLKLLMVLLLLGGIVLIFTSFRKCFKLKVYATECSPTPVSIGEGAVSLRGNSALYSVVSRPTKDTDKMINELGALIHDMQTMGDLAVSKWKA